MKPLATILAIALLTIAIAIAAPLLAAETQGKIVSVRPEQNQFVLSENIKNLTFQANNATRFYVNNVEAKLADIKAGDEARVTYERQGRELIASVVRCARK